MSELMKSGDEGKEKEKTPNPSHHGIGTMLEQTKQMRGIRITFFNTY